MRFNLFVALAAVVVAVVASPLGDANTFCCECVEGRDLAAVARSCCCI
jgi:hypothetical protein